MIMEPLNCHASMQCSPNRHHWVIHFETWCVQLLSCLQGTVANTKENKHPLSSICIATMRLTSQLTLIKGDLGKPYLPKNASTDKRVCINAMQLMQWSVYPAGTRTGTFQFSIITDWLWERAASLPLKNAMSSAMNVGRSSKSNFFTAASWPAIFCAWATMPASLTTGM